MQRLSLKRLSAVGLWRGSVRWASGEAQCGGPLGRAPLLGTPKDVRALFFLEPEDIKNVSLGAIWKFGKVIGHP
jgi:hypothetical protein